MKKLLVLLIFGVFGTLYWLNYVPIKTSLTNGEYKLISLKREYNYLTGYYYHARVVLKSAAKYNHEQIQEVDLNNEINIVECDYRKTNRFEVYFNGYVSIELKNASFIKDY